MNTTPDDGAVDDRDARFAYFPLAVWKPDDPMGEQYRERVRDAWERLRPFSTGGNYINFRPPTRAKIVSKRPTATTTIVSPR